MLTKYNPKGKNVWDLVKILFNGSRRTNPMDILKSDTGLDVRFSNKGFYGKGIYFADNSNYSKYFAYSDKQSSTYSMFFCFVIVGNSVLLERNKDLNAPPLKPFSDRYDSVRNIDSSHYVIYDTNK